MPEGQGFASALSDTGRVSQQTRTDGLDRHSFAAVYFHGIRSRVTNVRGHLQCRSHVGVDQECGNLHWQVI